MEWVSDGKVRRADFDVVLPAPEAARRLRTALDPDGDWITHVLRDANDELVEDPRRRPPRRGRARRRDRQGARRQARRPAGADHGRAAGHRALRRRRTPRRGSRASRPASAPWLVSVLMVSEGVDVPRLRVGVYATTARTELFFRQVIGRFIRRTPAPKEQMAHVFLPSDPRLKRLAIADRGGAQARARCFESERRGGRRAGRARRGRRGRSARCGRARGATTRCCRRRSPATRCSSSRSPRRRRSPALAAFTTGRRTVRAAGARDGVRAARAPARGASRTWWR